MGPKDGLDGCGKSLPHRDSIHKFHILHSDARCARKSNRQGKSRIQQKILFTSKLDLNLRKELLKCYIWSIALYGVDNWTPRKVDQKYPKRFGMWCWRRMGRRCRFMSYSSRTDIWRTVDNRGLWPPKSPGLIL